MNELRGREATTFKIRRLREHANAPDPLSRFDRGRGGRPFGGHCANPATVMDPGAARRATSCRRDRPGRELAGHGPKRLWTRALGEGHSAILAEAAGCTR